MFKTGLILADGLGTRMKSITGDSPKHLLALPNGQTIVGRIARELGSVCDGLICTVCNDAFLDAFNRAFSDAGVSVSLLVRKSEQEYSSIPQAAEIITQGNVIVTNGDLVFADDVIIEFVKRHGDQPHFFRGREGNPANKRGLFDIFNSRLSVVPYDILRDFSYSSRLKAARHLIVSLLHGRVDKVPSLFNVDTPQDYQLALKYFESLTSVQKP